MDIGPLNVLCIDDNESDYVLIERALRMAGILGHCERVQTMRALETALEGKRWDLVLSDYAVPGMYFTDTLRRLRYEYPNLPLILVSGTIGEVKASVLVKVGAWDYVLKNRLRRRLVPAVRRAIERAATQAAHRPGLGDA
jgi:DNA-binding NtrC family response regulator